MFHHAALTWFTAAALAVEPSSSTEVPDDAAIQLDRTIGIYGIVGLESLMLGLGRPLEDLVILSASVQMGIAAPKNAIRQGRSRTWDQEFGSTSLHVLRRRGVSGETLSRGETEVKKSAIQGIERNTDQLCPRSSIEDSRPPELIIWDDRTRRKVGEGDRARRQATPSLLFLEGEESRNRSVMVHLLPGESATVVEILQEVHKGPRRRIEMTRRHKRLVVHEMDDGTQVVCIDSPPKPPTSRKKQRQEKPKTAEEPVTEEPVTEVPEEPDPAVKPQSP